MLQGASDSRPSWLGGRVEGMPDLAGRGTLGEVVDGGRDTLADDAGARTGGSRWGRGGCAKSKRTPPLQRV
jgi:hypothetical protein